MSNFNIVPLLNGVYYVEIKEADLRILCASPADSVKHMMKNGLMKSKFKDGFFIEDGPNAVLLSDVMIQNGSFSNLTEFPILQMLYRQGLLVPNHPNNSGEKPLLIGSQEQISSQLDYILRGNYGLLSKEEILDCNIDEAFADEIMNMKLKFAFGKINSTDKLLDSIVVEKELVEIKNGVTIERKELNKFIICYKGESHTVDINLDGGDSYKSAYPLGFYNLNREHFAIIHSGEGDGWDIHRPCMSSILMHNGKIYLVDAGPNLDYILNSLGIGVNEIEGIFHTHSHDDHFSGLTTLLQADHKIKYYSTPLVQSAVSKKFAALLDIQDEDFGYYFDIHHLHFDEWNHIDSLEVMPILSPHPVETNIFHFRTMSRDGYKSYAHYADLTSFKVLESMIVDSNGAGIVQERYDKTIQSYLKPANIKKIDIGGGMIHGEVHDFEKDNSDQIILAHTSRELNNEDYTVGSAAPFGTVDTLIQSDQNYDFVLAYKYLSHYFPAFNPNVIQNLLNNPIKIFNPQSTIHKKGSTPNSAYLIITGNVEVISNHTDKVLKVNAGTLLGELEILSKKPLDVTYRAKSFVKVLDISAVHFQNFVETYEHHERLETLQEKREFFSNTWLFSESLTTTILNQLEEGIQLIKIKKGDKIRSNLNDNTVNMVLSGKLEYTFGDLRLGYINKGDFFGENVIFKKQQVMTTNVTEDSLVYKVPVEILQSVPYIRWKLYETSKRRFAHLLSTIPFHKNRLTLDSSNDSKINKINNLHQNLLDSFNILYYSYYNENPSNEEIIDALKNIILSAKNHFHIEGSLYIQYKHPRYKQHRKEHNNFIKLLEDAFIQFESKQTIDLDTIKEWIAKHFTEDKEMAKYLITKNIF